MNVLGISPEVLTPSVLLALVVLAIITGRLVPLRFYKNLIEERDQWRDSAQHSAQDVTRLINDADVSVRALASLKVEAAKLASGANTGKEAN